MDQDYSLKTFAVAVLGGLNCLAWLAAAKKSSWVDVMTTCASISAEDKIYEMHHQPQVCGHPAAMMDTKHSPCLTWVGTARIEMMTTSR